MCLYLMAITICQSHARDVLFKVEVYFVAQSGQTQTQLLATTLAGI